MSRLPGTTEAGTQARLRTAIVTGASRGIGAGVTRAFLDLGYNVVANALHFADSALAPNGNLGLVEGNIGQASTAMRITETAISRFGSIDAVVTNAGIFFTKPLTDYTPDDFRRLSETNLEGYLYITQLAAKRMLAQKQVGADTPMHANDPKEYLQSLSPMGQISEIQDIVDAVVYLTEARHVTGEVLHVDAGAHNGKW
jgi:NAD(P)-dependent dehydrogenase (short-subunit alcohol dehydrogenase family)